MPPMVEKLHLLYQHAVWNDFMVILGAIARFTIIVLRYWLSKCQEWTRDLEWV